MRYILAASLLVLAPAAWAESAAGLWDATIDYNGANIPFKFEISGDGANVKGWFFNGKDREVSNSGKLENGSLTLTFDSYLTKLTATVKDGTLDGEYGPLLKKIYRVHAVRATAASPSHFNGNAPHIDGQWDLENVNSSKKGEKTWRLILQQSGPDVSGAILRVDGDTGTLVGGYQDGKFVLSHFDGARAVQLILKPAADGTLDASLATMHGFSEMKAVRPEEARAKGLPAPVDADLHTKIKDPNAPFAFSFPDLNGHIVSNTDARFKGKVVLINITGSWCPNCHDEAPYLAKLYDQYKDQGLEIVALNFEEADQLQNPTRLRAFIKEYGIHYTVLLAGETDSAKEKLTQTVDWDAWPTTVFVGRDGLVHGIHAGFPSPGSGALYKQETGEFLAKVRSLLAENQSEARR